jgi:hypothetical protein
MAQLDINVPFETDQPRIVVDVDPRSPLPRGRQLFQLEVVDDSGNVSAPDQIVVVVVDRERPTTVLLGPQIVDFGKSFDLNGEKSFDIGGSIKSFRFTYLGPAL